MDNSNEETKQGEQAEIDAVAKKAAELEQAIATETAAFNQKIEELGRQAGINITTEVSIIFK